MKVGTDGVLLGSWVDVNLTSSILDIGAGTGLLSIMMAQKSSANIEAIEIDRDACFDAKINFEQSLWKDRLHLIEDDFLEYSKRRDKLFDLIVSNPPFFKNSLQSPDIKKNIARHSYSLPHEKLLDGVALLLTPNGRFALVIPSVLSKEFIVSARLKGLHPEKMLHVYSKESDAKSVRSLICFSFKDCKAVENRLSIYSLIDGQYTDEYKTLTKEFYLAF
jgi:tRNA1Val (adenine37-N6)-methyltransferase